jgi:inhibitor of KinA
MRNFRGVAALNRISSIGQAGIELFPLGDSAVTVQFGKSIDLATHRKIKALTAYLNENTFPGMIEYVPSFTSVTVFYDPYRVRNLEVQERGNTRCFASDRSAYEIVCSLIKQIVAELDDTNDPKPRVVEIPVCYGGEFGPDLEFVAEHNKLTANEVIEIHSNAEYLVYMIGFAPGFPYLGGMSERIATPRRPSPRLSIPAGTVGIGGMQTGIYPIESPGGWQLIGRTPTELFRPDENPPSLLQAGDIIRFRPISPAEYQRYKENRL